MKKEELFGLLRGCHAVSKLGGAKFAYAIAKNTKMLQEECGLIESLNAPAPEYQEYDLKRLDLARKFSEKDENGEPLVTLNGNMQSFVMADMAGFQAAHTELAEEYATTIASRETQVQDFKTLLHEDSVLEFYKVGEDQLPPDITPEQVLGIIGIID